MPRQRIDHTGHRFGRLLVVGCGGMKGLHRLWVCRCDCGSVIRTRGTSLRRGTTRSCGCLRGKDMTGQTFGRLVVVDQDGMMQNGNTLEKKWLCLCECGRSCTVLGSSLRRGHTKSCGCLRRELARCRLIDLAGRRFGRLTVVEYWANPKGRGGSWKCKCDCGAIVFRSSATLRRGKTKSCGCHRTF